jgi:hypothetical protein
MARKDISPADEAKFDIEYHRWMDFVTQDWEAAGRAFRNLLVNNPKFTTKTRTTAQNIDSILAGDRDAWQYGSGAKDDTDAMHFVVSNAMLRKIGLGVIPMRRGRYEDVVITVANMISEDVNFYPLTEQERRIKRLVESYGMVMYYS